MEGGGGINKCCAGGITVLYWLLSLFLEVMQQGLPGFAEVDSPISVDVIWMHLNFDGFSNETIHVAGLCRQEFSVLYSDDVIMIKTMFGNR